MSSSVTPISTLHHSSVVPHNQLAAGRMDANRTEAKESWEQSAYKPRAVLLPCISQAGCVCVRVGCCLLPAGRSVEAKEVGVWDELTVPLSGCPFWLPAAFSLWWELSFCWAVPSQFLNTICNFFFGGGGGSCHICFVNTQGGACCHVNKLDIPVLSPLLSSASSNYFFNPLIWEDEAHHLLYSESVSVHSSECEWSMISRALEP